MGDEIAMTENRFEFVARMYTGARRFPRWFGRFLDGTKVPGGPYKITQIIVGGIFFLVTIATYTLGWWRTGSPLMDLIFGGAAVAGVFWGSGKIPQTKRNPLALILSTAHAVMAPRRGEHRGRPVTLSRPHPTSSTRSVPMPRPAPSTQLIPYPQTIQLTAAAPEPTLPVTAPQTGLARLLAQAEHD